MAQISGVVPRASLPTAQHELSVAALSIRQRRHRSRRRSLEKEVDVAVRLGQED